MLLKRIRKVKSLNLKMGLPYCKPLEKYALKLAKNIKTHEASFLIMFAKSNKGAKPTTTDFAEWALKELNAKEAFENTSKIGNEYAREEETRLKEELLDDLQKESEESAESAKSLPDVKMFYMCSKHLDCAEDHELWQGKLYYDRFWRRYVKDEELRKQILTFIKENELNSMQWVINDPVWLITRPNCRHYFEKISIKEALSAPAEEILETHNMVRETGLRDGGQTIRHNTQKGWYTENNIEAIIRKYEERLVYHKKLYDTQPAPLLLNYIEKDRLLIRKWRYALKKL